MMGIGFQEFMNYLCFGTIVLVLGLCADDNCLALSLQEDFEEEQTSVAALVHSFQSEDPAVLFKVHTKSSSSSSSRHRPYHRTVFTLT